MGGAVFPPCYLPVAKWVAQMVTPLPTTQETWVQSLGWEDPLEKEMATHSSTLAWKIPWTRGAWWAIVHGVAKSQTQLNDFILALSLRFLKWFAIPFSSGPHSVKTLHHDPSVLGGLTQHGS